MTNPETTITVESALAELRETLPKGHLQIRADRTEAGMVHVEILNAYLPHVMHGPTLHEAMVKFRDWRDRHND